MGFNLKINNILRFEPSEPLELDKEFSFEKDSLSVLADDIQIWLTKLDWTPLAEIQVTSQQRKDNKTTGTFVVKYLYKADEQANLGKIFRRMYNSQ